MKPLDSHDAAFVALHREARERAAELGKKLGLPDEAVNQILAEVDEPGRLADLVAGYIDIPPAERQALLETLSVEDRLRRVLVHVQRQIDVLSAQEDIQEKVKEELGGRQREMYLREQLKAIQKELGEGEGADDESLKELRAKLDALDLPEEARKEVDREWARLTRIGRESMESQVIRTYLETIAELPWNSRSDEHLDVQEAARILDEDHYGLKDVKDRILEFLAVRQLLAGDAEKAKRDRDRRGGRSRASGRRGSARRTRCASRRARAGTDPSLRRPSRRREDLDREVDRARDGTQVRPHLARRRAGRGRHPRPSADVHRRDARADPSGDEAGGDEEPGLPPRRGRQARRLVSRATRRRRCSRSSTPRRTTASRTTTWRCRSTSPRSSSSRRPTSSRTSRARCSTGWRWSRSPATRSRRSSRSRRATSSRGSSRRTASPRAQLTIDEGAVAGGHFELHAGVRASGSSSASSGSWRGRWPAGSRPTTSRRRRSSRRTSADSSAGPGSTPRRWPARTRWESRPACTTRRPAATSCSSRRRSCAARAS